MLRDEIYGLAEFRRLTGARNLRESGVDETVIMKIGGWKTRSVFIRYAIVSTADMEAAFAKLEKAQGNFDVTSMIQGAKVKASKPLSR